MKDSQRVKPRTGLFVKIQNRIGVGNANIVPLRQRRYALAVAVLMLELNSKTLAYFIQQHQVNDEDLTDGNTNNQAPITK